MVKQLNPETISSFLEEARGYLPGMQQQLDTLRKEPADMGALIEMHRLAHNMRGAGGVIGLSQVAELGEGLEGLLEQVGEGSIAFDEEIADLISQGLAQLAEALNPMVPPAAATPAPQSAATKSIIEEAAGDLVEGFLVEAEEHLQIIGARLGSLEEDAGQKDVLQEVRRSVHTIKGASAMVGLEGLSKVAHRMEDLLDRLYENAVLFHPEVLQLLFATYDLMTDLVAAHGRTDGYGTRMEAIFEAYSEVLGSVQPGSHSRSGGDHETAAESQETQADGAVESAKHVRIPLERLDNLMKLVGELFVLRSSFEQQLAQYVKEIEELKLCLQRLKRLSSRLESGYTGFTPNLLPSSTGQADSEFDALEFDRYTELHLLSRDLNEAVGDVGTASSQLETLAGAFEGYINRNARLTTEAQDKLMRLRMVPIASIANRLQRTVRVAAAQRNKEAALIIEGDMAELDKTILEQMTAPLEHLLRNAVDHGVESPSVRAAFGKPERGEIRLRASREGTEAILVLSDDGGGIQYEKLRRGAVREGFLEEAEAAVATTRQLEDLLFLPGFTTADEISSISGRGVGLDVVKNVVESLKGSLEVKSEQGRGTAFIIRIPLNMAVARVLMVEASQETFALPLASITQTARVEPKQIQKIGSKEVIRLGRTVLTVVRLADSLHLRGLPQPPPRSIPVVAIRLGEEEFALVVDQIHEAKEVVVKPLAGIVRKVAGIAGATILGDGSVVLILNPPELPARATSAQALPRQRAAAPNAARKTLDVLIVDDSLSVRRVIANLIRNTGWNPLQAKDGVEALELLGKLDRQPDAILMDIEMPRMDGYELASRLRAIPSYYRTPILMLTSRSGEKHRGKAMSIGVTDYLVKPYQDEALLNAIRRSVEQSRRTAPAA